METELNIFQQYNRRESLEISGIPDRITQEDLEYEVLEILRRVGLTNLSSYNIVACHRLKRKVPGENYRRVIVRFTNRKFAYAALSRKNIIKNFRDKPGLYVHQSLCHKYNDVYRKCHELRSVGEIDRFWVYNGFIYMKRTNSQNENPTKILHINDLNIWPEIWPE